MLWGIRARAFSILDDVNQSRAAAKKGLTLARDPYGSAHAHLLIMMAENVSSPDEIELFRRSLTTARNLHRHGSAIGVCLQAQLGDILRQQDRPDAAAVALDDAYRSSLRLPDFGPRIMVLSRLATLAGYQSDTDQALTLLREQLRGHERLRQSFLVGLLHRRLGLMLNRADRFEEALVELRHADRILKPFDVPLITASLDVEACRAHLGLQQWQTAEARCRNARRIFVAHHSRLLTQATSQLARIRLGLGDPAGALLLFNSVLEKSGDKPASATATAQLQWRAKAYDMLGRHDEAYRDLQQYLAGYKKWNDAAAKKQAAEFRAQLDANRQAARSRALEVQLRQSLMRSRIERQFFVSAGIAALLALVLLSGGIVALNWHRQRLSQVARTDSLTGLLNRRAAVESAEFLMLKSQQGSKPLTFALLDLDHFKTINDAHGHAVGDAVLTAFASTMRTVVGVRGVNGRWGGEEFLVMLPNLDARASAAILDDIRAAVAALTFVFDTNLKISFSAGLAEHAKFGERLDDLMVRADVALYHAKKGGRSRTCVGEHSRRGNLTLAR